jgi:hypothetical protein
MGLGSLPTLLVIFALTSPASGRAAPLDWCAAVNLGSSSVAAALVARASRHQDDAPRPMPRLHIEGTLPHQDIYDVSIKAAQDFQIMRDAAFAWRLTGDRRYADQVYRYLAAWVATYRPSFNPIDETRLDVLIQAFNLARGALSPMTRTATEAFLRTLAEGYIERGTDRLDARANTQSATWVNNWESHRVKIATLAAAALADEALVSQAERVFIQQISNNIAVDGQVMDFAQRDALHYVVYDLEPLTMAAIAAGPFGRH